MPTHNAKSEYKLNYEADKKVLRAEFTNAIAPALDRALAELSHKHNEVETRELQPRRFCSAFDEVQAMALEGVQRWLKSLPAPSQESLFSAEIVEE